MNRYSILAIIVVLFIIVVIAASVLYHKEKDEIGNVCYEGVVIAVVWDNNKSHIFFHNGRSVIVDGEVQLVYNVWYSIEVSGNEIVRIGVE